MCWSAVLSEFTLCDHSPNTFLFQNGNLVPTTHPPTRPPPPQPPSPTLSLHWSTPGSHAGGITQHLSFRDWPVSVSIRSSRSVRPRRTSCRNVHPSQGEGPFPGTCIPHYCYMLVCRWAFRLCPRPGYQERCGSEHGGASTSAGSPESAPQSVITGSYIGSIFKSLRSLHGASCS